MPKTPKGAKRPADVIANAVTVMKIATGEIEEGPDTRNQAALALSKLAMRASFWPRRKPDEIAVLRVLASHLRL